MPNNRNHYFTLPEWDSLLTSIGSDENSIKIKAIFILSYHHGLRASEVKLLQYPSHLDFRKDSGGLIYITRLKGSISSWQSLSREEDKILRQWLKIRGENTGCLFPGRWGIYGEGISRQTLDRIIRTYGRLANIPIFKLHFHSIKHTLATHLAQKSEFIDPFVIRELLGHSDIKSTMKYVGDLGEKSKKKKEEFDRVIEGERREGRKGREKKEKKEKKKEKEKERKDGK